MMKYKNQQYENKTEIRRATELEVVNAKLVIENNKKMKNRPPSKTSPIIFYT